MAQAKKHATKGSGPQRTGEAQPSDRRQEVVDEAAKVFAQFGYHGVSTRALADQLGIKVASLYFHFKSKDEALQEICHRGIDSSLRIAEAALNLPPALEDRLRFYFGQMHESFAKEADYINVFIHERRHIADEARKSIDAKVRRLRKLLLNLFEEAKEAGDLRDDLSPRSASFIMIGTIRHLSQLYTEGPSPDFDTIMKDSVEALLRGLVKGKA